MGTRRALVVGVDSYASAPLDDCVNDATEVAELLAEPEYGFDVTLLLNGDAARRSLKTALSDLLKSDASTALFYFAGHGIQTDFGTYLASIDFDEVDPGIDVQFLARLLSASSGPAQAVCVLDCCHSGAAGLRGRVGGRARAFSREEFNNAITAFLPAGRAILAACRPDEVSWEKPSLHHGLFTYHLLEALYGDAADERGEVTVTSTYDYIVSTLPDDANQNPVFKGEFEGRLVLGTNLKPRTLNRLPAEELSRIELMAQSMMDDFMRGFSTDISTRREHGYRDACQLLAPKLQWLERKQAKHTELAHRPSFQTAYSAARRALADLAHLDPGTMTPLGVAESRIGSGQFGSVWKVISPDGTPIAYKLYHPADLDDVQKLGRFERGYHAMQQLNHPNIVQVRHFTNCPVGFAMDYVEGSNAREYAGGSQTAQETIAQLVTVAETLRHAHSRGVVHRDVKPENVILSWDDPSGCYEPHLTDFDLAWFSSATQLTKTTGIGTLLYAAPEQLQLRADSATAHAKTVDVFSFGQLIYFFLMHSDPDYGGDNAANLRRRIADWPSERAARAAVELFSDCTMIAPQSRIQDMDTVCDKLYAIRTALMGGSMDQTLPFMDFVRELAFGISGLSDSPLSEPLFRTRSGRTEVNVRATDDSPSTRLELTLWSTEPPFMAGKKNQEAIQTLNKRIDDTLRQYLGTTRRSGSRAPYEVIVTLEGTPLTLRGLERCRAVLGRVVDVVEST